MRKLHIAILSLLFLAFLTSSLHFERVAAAHLSPQSELQALRAQQVSFQKQINGLVSNISQIEAKVSKVNSTDEKVIILQNAILSERERIFEIQNEIIPPFNLSKNACQELTNEQKIHILDQVVAARAQIEQLQTVASRIPPCEEIALINSDLSKQRTLIDSIERIVYSKCDSSIVLSPSVFQSNIYASNWILGDQSIDDLIEEYYQRSIQYHNVTNCPEQFPFFDGKACLACGENYPVFNMKTKQCDRCPYDTAVNTDLRTCQQIPHFADYSTLENYLPDSPIPPVDPGLTPCPSRKPYFNGTCVACKLPSYWSIKDNKCKSCLAGNVFDVNIKSCTKPIGLSLTVLEDTKWVTNDGNLTRVLAQRAEYLKNKTNPTYCTLDSPYYDGIECISCPLEFNIDTGKCSAAPPNTVYDDNLHAYLTPESPRETYPKATNILALKPLMDTSVVDCNFSAPYYDGIACIACPYPFTLFDVLNKKCVTCQTDEIYNSSTLKCDKRANLWISTNFNSLMATFTYTVSDYKADLLAAVNNSGEMIVQKCPDTLQYSNLTNCFKCAPGQLFNIVAKKCDSCNGTIDAATSVCIPKKTLLTNLSAPDLIVGPNKTIDSYANQQKTVLGPVQDCPALKPYAVAGINCISCEQPTPYFNLDTQKCTGCPSLTFYDNKTRTCEKGLNISNLAALKDYVEIDNYTIANLNKQNNAQTRPTVLCPTNLPIFDGSKCKSCPNSTYVNLKTFECVGAKTVTNVYYLEETSNYFEVDNYTLENIAESIDKLAPLPVAPCPDTAPVFNGVSCYFCPVDKFYNLKTNECVSAVTVSNTTALRLLKNVKESGNFTLTALEKNITDSKLPTTVCNETKPLFNGKKCLACDNYSQYDLQNLTCILPKLYTNTTAIKNLKYIESGNVTLASLDAANAKIPAPSKPCPAAEPFFTGSACIVCPNGTYYDLKNLNCHTPVLVSNTDALLKSKFYMEVDNFTIANLDAEIAKTIPHQICPATEPLFNNVKCTACPNGTYYNLKTLACYTAPFVTNTDVLIKNKTYVEADNFTIANLQADIAKIVPHQSCPASEPFFNKVKCIVCPNGTYYNLKTNECFTPFLVSNTDALIKSKTYVEIDNFTIANLQAENAKVVPQQSCPPTTPLYDKANCIGCPNGTFYNLKTLSCYTPPLVTNTEVLLKAKNYVEIDNFTIAKIDAENAKIVPRQACPAATPLFNNKSCVACENGTYYNLKTLTCFTPLLVSNVDALLKSKAYVEVDNSTLPNLNKEINAITLPKTPCPEKTPLFDGKICIACPNSLYNLKTLQCFNCTIDQFYNVSTASCVPKPHFFPNLTNPDWIVNDDAGIDRVLALIKSRQQLDTPHPCPEANEFFNNKTLNCQTCPNGTYFNYDTFACAACPKGQEIDYNTHKCNVRTVGKFQTSLSSPNLIYGGYPKNQYVDYYNGNKTTYPAIQDCPQEKPYFDGFECIKCAESSPYFDMVYQLCTRCTAPAVYDAEAMDCREDGELRSSPPNPAKMYSSIF